jgi:hypothetical protein
VDAVWESFERSGDVFALWDSLIGELAVLGSMAMAAGVGLLFLVGWALCGFFSNKRDMQRQGHDGGP